MPVSEHNPSYPGQQRVGKPLTLHLHRSRLTWPRVRFWITSMIVAWLLTDIGILHGDKINVASTWIGCTLAVALLRWAPEAIWRAVRRVWVNACRQTVARLD